MKECDNGHGTKVLGAPSAVPFGNGNACAAQGLDQPWRSRGARSVVARGQGDRGFQALSPCPWAVPGVSGRTGNI